MGAGLVGLHPPLAVGQGDGRVEKVPGVGTLDPVRGRGQDQAGAAQGQRPGHLGEVAVEVDHQSHAAECGVVERRQLVARAEHGGLERGRVEMGLAVPGLQLALGIEDEGGVVHAAVVTQLGHGPGRQPHGAPPGRLAEGGRAGPVQRLGIRPRILGQGLGVVATRPELGQQQKFDATRCGVVHHAERHVHVLARLPWCGQPLGHTNQKISLHVGYLVFPPLYFALPLTLGRQRSPFVSRT